MKPVLFLAAAGALALIGAPAFTQTSAPPVDTMGTPAPGVQNLANSPYRGPDLRRDANRCFDGRHIVGANRSGLETVIVQPRRGPIYQLQLADSCEALKTAAKITVRAAGGSVCPGQEAVLVADNPGGAKHCRVKDVRPLTSAEIAALAAAAPR
jgi:hypothetical protein